MLELDVLIAGAGPAGAALAARMAALGYRVLLCERAEFPRPKLCGEFLSPEVLRYLERLGVGDAPSTAGAALIRSATFATALGAPATHELPAPALGMSRQRLDPMLVDLARARGAGWRPRCRVIQIERVPEMPGPGSRTRPAALFRVTSLVDGTRGVDHARAVVDARGRARGRRIDGGGGRGFVGLQRHYRPRRRARVELAESVRLHVFAGGYLGLAPVEDGLVNLCLLARTHDLRRAGGRPDALVAAIAAQDLALQSTLAEMDAVQPRFSATSGISFGVAPPGRFALAIGDAAVAISPIAGDGIAMALRSAEIASPILDGYLRGDFAWDEARRELRRRWRREFTRRLTAAALVHRAATNAWTQRAIVAALRRSPALLGLLYRGTRDARPRAGAA